MMEIILSILSIGLTLVVTIVIGGAGYVLWRIYKTGRDD
jgi:hypothetical protein